MLVSHSYASCLYHWGILKSGFNIQTGFCAFISSLWSPPFAGCVCSIETLCLVGNKSRIQLNAYRSRKCQSAVTVYWVTHVIYCSVSPPLQSCQWNSIKEEMWESLWLWCRSVGVRDCLHSRKSDITQSVQKENPAGCWVKCNLLSNSCAYSRGEVCMCDWVSSTGEYVSNGYKWALQKVLNCSMIIPITENYALDGKASLREV